jgi:hypothetical protein
MNEAQLMVSLQCYGVFPESNVGQFQGMLDQMHQDYGMQVFIQPRYNPENVAAST